MPLWVIELGLNRAASLAHSPKRVAICALLTSNQPYAPPSWSWGQLRYYHYSVLLTDPRWSLRCDYHPYTVFRAHHYLRPLCQNKSAYLLAIYEHEHILRLLIATTTYPFLFPCSATVPVYHPEIPFSASSFCYLTCFVFTSSMTSPFITMKGCQTVGWWDECPPWLFHYHVIISWWSWWSISKIADPNYAGRSAVVVISYKFNWIHTQKSQFSPTSNTAPTWFLIALHYALTSTPYHNKTRRRSMLRIHLSSSDYNLQTLRIDTNQNC